MISPPPPGGGQDSTSLYNMSLNGGDSSYQSMGANVQSQVTHPPLHSISLPSWASAFGFLLTLFPNAYPLPFDLLAKSFPTVICCPCMENMFCKLISFWKLLKNHLSDFMFCNEIEKAWPQGKCIFSCICLYKNLNLENYKIFPLRIKKKKKKKLEWLHWTFWTLSCCQTFKEIWIDN